MEQNRKPRDLKELTSAALKVYAQEEREAPVLAEVRTLEAEIADAAFDHVRLQELYVQKEALEQKLELLYEQWGDLAGSLEERRKL